MNQVVPAPSTPQRNQNARHHLTSQEKTRPKIFPLKFQLSDCRGQFKTNIYFAKKLSRQETPNSVTKLVSFQWLHDRDTTDQSEHVVTRTQEDSSNLSSSFYFSSKSRRTSRKQAAKPRTSKCENYSHSGTLHGIRPNMHDRRWSSCSISASTHQGQQQSGIETIYRIRSVLNRSNCICLILLQVVFCGFERRHTMGMQATVR